MNEPSVFGIEVSELSKKFQSKSESLTVLKDVSFSIESSTHTCSIVGPSGSGKTTLLGLCAGTRSTHIRSSNLEWVSNEEP